jgi:signal transduction histidine kinase
MSPKSEHVERELLNIGFRAYPRGLANGFIFASLSVMLMWEHMPHGLLLAWLAGFCLLLGWRYALARAYLRKVQPVASFARWVRLAAVAYGGTGFMWGILCAGAIHFAFDEKIYMLWTAFLIVLFTVLQSQTTGNKPLVLRSFLLSAVTPILLVSILEPSPNYWLRLMAECAVIGIALLAGRAGNRNAAESIAVRYENLELLQELTRQKEALDRANEGKTRFLAAASHDLRQPMQAVVLLMESLQERVHEPGTRRIVENISSSVNAMASLLNELLDISRFDAGTVKPQLSSIPVEDVLQRLRTSFSEPAARKGLSLRVRPSHAVVRTDPVLLYRLLSNLVHNAVRYTHVGGVVVGCRARMDGLSIEVWDTGIGIPPSQIGEIFREFYQVDNPQRDRDQGLGLGLAIVERTARVLGHPLAVRSRPGKGTVFSLLVRYGDSAAVLATPIPRPNEVMSGCVVLLVEDSPEIRSAMTTLLEGWGCRVLAAGSAAEVDVLPLEGLALHAIIADNNLPGGENGLALLRRLRGRIPGARAILMSGDIGPRLMREAEEAGVPLLHKPLRPARLRALMGSVWREARVEAAE